MAVHLEISSWKRGTFLKFGLPQQFWWKNGPKIRILTKPVTFLKLFHLFKLNLPMSDYLDQKNHTYQDVCSHSKPKSTKMLKIPNGFNVLENCPYLARYPWILWISMDRSTFCWKRKWSFSCGRSQISSNYKKISPAALLFRYFFYRFS